MAGSKGPFDLELLREILKDQSLHISIARIVSLHMAKDRSVLRLKVSVFPEEREQIVRMAWETVGPSAGFVQLPSPDDLVLIGQAEGDEEQAFVLRRLTSTVDTIPTEADSGDIIAKALAGKNARLISDTKIFLAKPDSMPTENIPLGQVLKAMLSTVLEAVAQHKHIGNLGYLTAVPDNATVYTEQKASPVDDEAMLSDLSFTEK